VPLSRSAGNPSNTMWSARRSILPYQVASSSIEPFGHNSVGCHSLRRNISTNYLFYFVVEMHTVTVRSDDARYLLKKFNYLLSLKLLNLSTINFTIKVVQILHQNSYCTCYLKCNFLRNSISATDVRDDYISNL